MCAAVLGRFGHVGGITELGGSMTTASIEFRMPPLRFSARCRRPARLP